MLHIERIVNHLARKAGRCDDCIADQLDIYPRQTVYRLCNRSSLVRRSNGTCASCGKDKFVRFLKASVPKNPTTPTSKPRAKRAALDYHREADLRTRCNQVIVSTLRIAEADYYGQLSFEEFLLLKAGLARIHDIITLKLTFALVDRIGKRLDLDQATIHQLDQSVRAIHPNAAGFDVDSQNPNLVGEVKGCIPMNAGATFGAAQLKSLTNDVLQMLGYPASGKQQDQLSQRTKIRRPNRAKALKFLGLYDSPAIREATEKWKRSLMNSRAWEPLLSFDIQDLPVKGVLSPNVIYLAYLKPTLPAITDALE